MGLGHLIRPARGVAPSLALLKSTECTPIDFLLPFIGRSMNSTYSLDDIPGEVVETNGKTWEREKYDSDSFQWVRELNRDEYDWDADDVSLVGTDVPIRVVSLQFDGGEWFVEGAETAGPDYHRPGFTELIGGEFSASFTNLEDAVDEVLEYIHRLS